MIIDVAVPYRLPTSFHYLIEPETAKGVALGSIVQVPFRNRLTHAFVLGFPTESQVDVAKLKTVESVLVAEPLFDEVTLKFLRWVSEYYCHPIGEVIAAAVPRQSWEGKDTKRRKRKLDQNSLASLSDLVASPTRPPNLNDEQRAALASILDPNDKKPVLIHGVTGSGKTEIYMAVMEATIAAGRGAIVLVPEIALTPQLLGRFSGRFPGQVAVLHSDLTPRERFDQWERLRKGEARIVIGARSAVFAPVKDLGLIVVDEEHETSFKQEDSLKYHGRDVAVVRGGFTGAKVVLGSATPSLESYANAHSGKYTYVQLKNRVENRPMPQTLFVDLKDETLWYSPKVPWITKPLIGRVEKALREGSQCLLYLNRLGFAHFLFCHDCGHTWRCKNCDVSLTYYRHPPRLKCHYCGVNKSPPNVCEECQGTKLDTMGFGTEQVEKELKGIFPNARIARFDRSVIKTRGDLEGIINSINGREVDIVIGTQMIAKGHDFPGIALVGILVADSSLNLPDFRAHERTFQVITQVSGRAGRAQTPGEVVIQTINPEHPVLVAAAAHAPADYYRTELEARKAFGFPPYQRLAMLRFQHSNLKKVEAFSYEVVHFIQTLVGRRESRCVIFGPSEAPLARLKNLYRWQCLLKSDSVKDLQKVLHRVHAFAAEKKSNVRLDMDVDPISSM